MNPDQASAKIKYLRISARKMRPIIDLVRGKRVTEAENILALLPHKGARLAKKALASAIGNAKNKNINIGDLIISKITADAGPPFKRFIPWSRGVARPVLKRTSHLTIVLSKGLPKKLVKFGRAKRIIKRVVKGSPKMSGVKKEKSSGSKSKPNRAKTKNQ